MTNWMAGFADLLLPDPAARIAIDETIDDYRDERAQAESIAARVWIDVQGVAALGRVVALTAVRDLRASDTWRVVGSSALLSMTVVPMTLHLASSRPLLDLILVPSDGVFAVLQVAALAFGPIVALGWFERVDRPARIAGPLVASALLMLVVMGWLVPLAPTSNVWPSPNELDLPSLIRRSWNDSWNLMFTQALVIRAALILAAPTGLLLGTAIRRRWRNRANWPLLQASGLLAAVAIIVSVWLCREAWTMSLFRGQSLNLLPVGSLLPLFTAWLATIALVRVRRDAPI
jgi:hypothetical protein